MARKYVKKRMTEWCDDCAHQNQRLIDCEKCKAITLNGLNPKVIIPFSYLSRKEAERYAIL